MAGEIKYLGRKNEERKEDYKVRCPVVDKSGSKTGKNTTLIWGDPVRVLAKSGTTVTASARATTVQIPDDLISDTGSLLEIYVIDVGQGDSILMKTPDGHWHVIDAGLSRQEKVKMTKKSASNFIHWKFMRELGSPLYNGSIVLKNAILTHPDLDHYGGFSDILSGHLREWDAPCGVQVENFYHNGIGRFTASPKLGRTVSGTAAPFPKGAHGVDEKGTFITELLDQKADFRTNMNRFSDDFKKLAEFIVSVPKNVARLSNKTGYLPGYGPGQNEVTIQVLGPILEDFGMGGGLRDFGSDSETVNGHSVVLRVCYGDVSILLAGDLNRKSQQLLLSYWDKKAFESDVAKACHHGAEDIYFEFVQALGARATVISSGDNESYAHPRPILMGASARYGRESVDLIPKRRAVQNDTIPPLIYSTELARSVKLDFASSVSVRGIEKGSTAAGGSGNPPPGTTQVPKKDVLVKAEEWKEQKYPYRTLDELPISTNLVYGLINVRTDGNAILTGTLLETGRDFDIKVFRK